jgi:hypothetical protein
VDKPFSPAEASGPTPDAQRTLAVTSSVQVLTLPSTTRLGATVRVLVSGGNIAFAWGAAPGLTIDNGVPMLGGTVEVFTPPNDTSQMAFISDTTATVRVTVGEGN